MIQSLEPLLQSHPFFAGLPDEWMELVAGCAKNVRFHAGEYILKEGDPAKWLYLIRNGDASVQIDGVGRGTLIVHSVHEGDLLGWSWLVPPHIYAISAQALNEVRAFAIDGDCLRTKCDDKPDLGYEVLKRVSASLVDRLASTRLQLLDLYGSHND